MLLNAASYPLRRRVSALILGARNGPLFRSPYPNSCSRCQSEGSQAGPLRGSQILYILCVGAIPWSGAEQHVQARATWQWSNFLAELNADGRPVLRVNLDETSLKLHIPPRPGLVVEPCPKRRRRLLQEGSGPDLSTRRAAVTLVAFACDDELVQQALPQVFVVNEHVVTKGDVADMLDRCKDNVLVVRRKSSWVTAEFMVQLLQLLARCLKSQLQTHHVVLHMDTCPAHLHPSVLKACSDAGMYLQVIPASATAWLQPLDVSVFAKFKNWVTRELERQRLSSTSGMLTRPEVLDVYRRGVDEVIRAQCWARAFELCGLRGQERISSRLLARLELDEPLAIGCDLPSLADLQVVFPTGKDIPIELCFQTALTKTAARPASVLRLALSARLPRAPAPL